MANKKDVFDALDEVAKGAELTATSAGEMDKKKKTVKDGLKQKVVFIDPSWEKAFDEADMGMTLTAYIRSGFKLILERDGIFPHKE